MNVAKLNRIADRMATEGFVVDLHLTRLKMDRAMRVGAHYDEADLAKDLGLPVQIALILIRFIAATDAEHKMSDLIHSRPYSGAQN